MTREEIMHGLYWCNVPYAAYICEKCSYFERYGHYECVEHLMREAHGLLEEKRPRVLTLEEVRALQDGAAVWIEDNDKVVVIPAIVNHVWNSLPNMVSFTAAYTREVKADMLWYGVKWRCWTSCPTDEQREATPWA